MSTAMNILLWGGIMLLLVAVWSAQRSKHPFDVRDVLMDQATGKASLNALILITFAALSCWVVIDRENDGKDDVGSILNIVLGIFVAGRVAAQVVSAINKPQEPGATVEQVTTRTETTTIPAPPVPEAPKMPPPLTSTTKAKKGE